MKISDTEQLRRDCEAFYWIGYAMELGHPRWQAQKAKLIKVRGKDAVDVLVSDMERLRKDVTNVDI